jgi:glyoxylate reductase
MALILSAARRVIEGADVVRAGGFAGWSPTWMMGVRLRGKKLGIVGMGRIGAALAHRARAFGLSIHYYNRRPVPVSVSGPLEATYWDSLDQMLAHMDVVSVNCPHTPGTFHLLSARRLRLLQPHAILVNTARGEIVDEAELASMLAEGRLAGVGLDVYEHEPTVNPRLLKLPGAVLLPHLGSATVETRVEMGEKVIINIKAFMDGHRPPDRVLLAML